MPVYEKLVRDGIPDLIASQGKDFNTRILESKEYITELRKNCKKSRRNIFRQQVMKKLWRSLPICWK